MRAGSDDIREGQNSTPGLPLVEEVWQEPALGVFRPGPFEEVLWELGLRRRHLAGHHEPLHRLIAFECIRLDDRNGLSPICDDERVTGLEPSKVAGEVRLEGGYRHSLHHGHQGSLPRQEAEVPIAQTRLSSKMVTLRFLRRRVACVQKVTESDKVFRVTRNHSYHIIIQ
jgi:hypothetical protein